MKTFLANFRDFFYGLSLIFSKKIGLALLRYSDSPGSKHKLETATIYELESLFDTSHEGYHTIAKRFKSAKDTPEYKSIEDVKFFVEIGIILLRHIEIQRSTIAEQDRRIDQLLGKPVVPRQEENTTKH